MVAVSSTLDFTLNALSRIVEEKGGKHGGNYQPYRSSKFFDSRHSTRNALRTIIEE